MAAKRPEAGRDRLAAVALAGRDGFRQAVDLAGRSGQVVALGESQQAAALDGSRQAAALDESRRAAVPDVSQREAGLMIERDRWALAE